MDHAALFFIIAQIIQIGHLCGPAGRMFDNPVLESLFLPLMCILRDDHGGDPYHGGYDLGYGGGGGPSYAPPQPWGHPDMHLMQPHHGIPIQAR